MANEENRKERIAALLGSSTPEAPRRTISVGNGNTIVVGGDLTIGQKIVTGSAAPEKKGDRRRAWRDEVCAAIRVRAFELKLTEDQVVALAASVLRKSVVSLDPLTAAELGRVFDSMHNLKRPALDD